MCIAGQCEKRIFNIQRSVATSCVAIMFCRSDVCRSSDLPRLLALRPRTAEIIYVTAPCVAIMFCLVNVCHSSDLLRFRVQQSFTVRVTCVAVAFCRESVHRNRVLSRQRSAATLRTTRCRTMLVERLFGATMNWSRWRVVSISSFIERKKKKKIYYF